MKHHIKVSHTTTGFRYVEAESLDEAIKSIMDESPGDRLPVGSHNHTWDVRQVLTGSPDLPTQRVRELSSEEIKMFFKALLELNKVKNGTKAAHVAQYYYLAGIRSTVRSNQLPAGIEILHQVGRSILEK